jgi:hypothetical protein
MDRLPTDVLYNMAESLSWIEIRMLRGTCKTLRESFDDRVSHGKYVPLSGQQIMDIANAGYINILNYCILCSACEYPTYYHIHSILNTTNNTTLEWIFDILEYTGTQKSYDTLTLLMNNNIEIGNTEIIRYIMERNYVYHDNIIYSMRNIIRNRQFMLTDSLINIKKYLNIMKCLDKIVDMLGDE